MHIDARALVLSLAVVACSANDAVAPTPAPHPQRTSAPLNLGLIGTTPLNQSVALAINDSGVIVGYAQVGSSDAPRAVVWRPPDYLVTVLPDAGAKSSAASSIGRDGTIGGRICESTGATFPCHPVYWRDGVLHQLGGVGEVKDVCECDGHTLIGRTSVNGHDHAAIWEDDILIDAGTPADFADADFVAIAPGNIVGMGYLHSEQQTGRVTPYRWSRSTGWIQVGPTDLNVNDVNARGTAIGGRGLIWLNGSNSAATMLGEGFPVSINDSNVVAGDCVPDPQNPTPTGEPCEWTSAAGWFAIDTNTTADVNGINNSNEVVGSYFSFAENRSFALLWKP